MHETLSIPPDLDRALAMTVLESVRPPAPGSAAPGDGVRISSRLESILHYGGLPMDHRCVTEALEQHAARGVAA